jgi:outer membrane biogenesis lipoprotein LolB
MKKTPAIIAAASLAAVALLTGCGSDASKASENLSKAADQFEVQRKIVGVNGITGKYEFYVEGRCSIDPQDRKLVVTCKHGPNDYRKHYVGLSDNTFYVATQLEGIDVSVYHTRVILKPENLIPEIDLQGGKQ